MRILTNDFPQYFALLSRVRQDIGLVGPDGGVLSSTVVPQVQAVFPDNALMKRIRVGLQVSEKSLNFGLGQRLTRLITEAKTWKMSRYRIFVRRNSRSGLSQGKR